MKARFSVLALALAGASFAAPGCGGGGVHAPIRIELAPVVDCSVATDEFPAELRYFTISICPSMGGGDCALLTDPGGDHAGGVPLLRVTRTNDHRFTIDARLDGSMSYDVTVAGYSESSTSPGTCTPTALGHALGVRLGTDDVDVRLYPLGQWSCAGIHDGSATSVPRALHQAVLLPNHEVLLLGGVRGPSAPAVTFMHPPMGAQTLVEVFDPADARFHEVHMTDEDGAPGFSRVMFQARYLGTTASHQYEIHTYGGFDIGSAPEGGVAFDGNANASTVGALFGPLSAMMTGAGAGFRTDAVILYDPATRSATITSHAVGNYTTTAATEELPTIGVVRSIDSVSVVGAAHPIYGLTAAWYVDGGRQGTLMADRLGASITPISPTAFLIWGGHVASSTGAGLTAAEVTTLAGEVVSSMTTTASTLVSAHDATVMPDDGLPFPTAYHTATHIAGPTGSTAILFAGGFVLGAGPTPLGTASFVDPSLTVSRFSPTGAIVGSERVAGPIATVLHTANAVDSSNTSVLLVGGASQMTAGGVRSTLFGEKTAGVVSFDPATSTYSWHMLHAMMSERWGHTTTIIPGHGVLVVGGISRVGAMLTVSDSSEFFLWEDLRGMGAPVAMSCDAAPDAGMTADAGARDTGPRVDANVDANVDAASSHDTGTD